MLQTKSKFLLHKLFIYFILLSASAKISAQNLYAGIEIGSKGIKMSILEIKNAKKGNYTLIDFWTENAAIAKGISIDGKLAAADIENAVQIVNSNYEKLLKKHNIPNNHIYIVASSGVGMASNTDVLLNKIKKLTNKDAEILTAKLEAKLLYRGCIPPNDYENAMLVDIGGGNTKGGYANLLNENLVFFPLSLNLGTITLTEKINKKMPDTNLDKYLYEAFKNQPELSDEVNQMYAQRPLSKQKKHIYMSGGAVWAFFILYKKEANKVFNEFTLEELEDYNAMVQNNFSTFSKLAETNTEAARVLKTYSQKHLISANNLLIASVQNVGALKDKKLYFAKNGQIAWLMSYVADASKGVAVIY